MRPLLILVSFALATQFFHGETRLVRTGPDVDDLYARLSGSSFVVKGRVLSYRGAGGSRVPAGESRVTPQGIVGRMDDHVFGMLFTVGVDDVVGRQTDFTSTAGKVEPIGGSVQIFVPSLQAGKFSSIPTGGRPQMLVGRQYLLFLRKIPGQEELVSLYGLDASLTYYEPYGGERGAVALPDGNNPEKPYTFVTPLLEAVTTFCEAVKPANVDAKIRNLSAVRSRFDYPAWRQSVDQAVRALQASQAQTAR
jgi:hypothetical protein